MLSVIDGICAQLSARSERVKLFSFLALPKSLNLITMSANSADNISVPEAVRNPQTLFCGLVVSLPDGGSTLTHVQYRPKDLLCKFDPSNPCRPCRRAQMVFAKEGKNLNHTNLPQGCPLYQVKVQDLVDVAAGKIRQEWSESNADAILKAEIDLCVDKLVEKKKFYGEQ
jgi:hypothetical protein